MHDSNPIRCALCALLSVAVAACAAGGPVSDRPVSYLALRYEATVPQQQDFTCGGASLATLLTYYWSTPTSEAGALATLSQRYNDSQIRHLSETGQSLDDLIFMANRLGFSAEGAKLPIEQLAKLAGPVIVHLNKGALQHFVVLRRVGDGVFYVSDPVVGELAMHVGEFEAQYTGYALAVWKPSAKLPVNTRLTNPRDGIRVADSLRAQINVPNWPFHPGF